MHIAYVSSGRTSNGAFKMETIVTNFSWLADLTGSYLVENWAGGRVLLHSSMGGGRRSRAFAHGSLSTKSNECLQGIQLFHLFVFPFG
jgi:hypothetical protein